MLIGSAVALALTLGGAELNDAVDSDVVVTGQWNYNFAACKKYAEANALPLLVFWSNPGCAKCNALKNGCNTEAFKTWRKAQNVVFCISEGNGTVKSFAKNNSGHFPYMRLYWPAGGVDYRFSGRRGEIGASGATVEMQLMNLVDSKTKGVTPSPKPITDDDAVIGAEWNKARTIYGGYYEGDGFAGLITVKAGKVNKQGYAKLSAKVTGLDGKAKAFKSVSVKVAKTTKYSVVKAAAVINLGVEGSNLSGSYQNGTLYYTVHAGLSVGGGIKDGNLAFSLEKGPASVKGMDVLTEFLPNGVVFKTSNSRWSFPVKGNVSWDRQTGKFVAKNPSNVAALKLTYKPNTGFFKGTCKVYVKQAATRVKTFAANVTGYWISGEGYGQLVIKNNGAYDCRIEAAD